MILEIVIISLLVVAIALLCVVIFKPQKQKLDIKEIENLFNAQNQLLNQTNQLLITSFSASNENILKMINQTSAIQRQDIQSLSNMNEEKMKQAIEVLQKGLDKLSIDNEKKLEQMRQTVDEKLNVSLERRLSESFNTINQRLQSVYEGLGEMKNLATGVGDLKKVLNNVKTRGIWGEVSLGNILEQMLTREQFASQVMIKDNQDRVDFAVLLPGRDDQNILLPIDSKFPLEDYQRLVNASEIGDIALVEQAVKGIEKRVKEEAKKIGEKYIHLPKTTDFALMYLAIEGLYAEVLRIPGLVENLQREHKIIVCGPTTLSALLNSLQLGFKTLSIEKRSSEIWSLLGGFKQEFSKFVDLLSKTQKKLMEASNTIESATKKSRTIERKLRKVDVLEDSEEELLEDMSDAENL